MGKYSVDELKRDIQELQRIGPRTMGFRPSATAEDTRRKTLKERLKKAGFAVDMQSKHTWITIDTEDE